MIHASTKQIEQYFIENNIRCNVADRGEMSVVQAGFNGKVAKNILVHFISAHEGNDIAVRVFNLAPAPEDRRSALLEHLNELNNRYRYVKFTLAKDNSVQLSADVPVKVTNPGEVCAELFVRIMQIVDALYSDLMHIVWG